LVNIGAICDTDATTVCAGTELSKAARLLSTGYTDALVAIASPAQRPTAIGILTYREILTVLVRGDDLGSVRVLDVLDANPLVLNEEEEIEAAILKLRSRGARYAPVIGSGGTLWGIVSLDRLLGCRALSLQFRSAAPAETTYK
jgi:CBS domain-containing protein